MEPNYVDKFGILEEKCKRLEQTLGTLITWINSSAVGVLSNRDATALLEMLKEK